eukprot:CAMPEP_0194420138 /NCGR_PEP_ID=MMETSP0176-20130528/19380_1 /TAXON_ID=216777 /ORGANISM="Proboscia alata, Strain PI-D3" /LENGTH=406 /DNA_ID=CAMNT_0039227549 /DNA_START=1 /DNA_END=1224 /DNA_ORIENTATION=-
MDLVCLDIPPSSPQEFPAANIARCVRICANVYETDSKTQNFESDILTRTDHLNLHNKDPTAQAYVLGNTIKMALYGRVRIANVLKRYSLNQGDTNCREDNGCEWEMTTDQCAVKELDWSRIKCRSKDSISDNPVSELEAINFLRNLRKEFENCEEMDHVVTPTDLLFDKQKLYMIFPFCNGGELFDVLKKKDKFSEEEARIFMMDILRGLKFLQRVGICHRDISLENIMIHDKKCRIIDFGMCLLIPFASTDCHINKKSDEEQKHNDKAISSNTKYRVFPKKIGCANQFRLRIKPQGKYGKTRFMSPEVYNNVDAFDGFSVDLWSAGIVLFIMVIGVPPWEKPCNSDRHFYHMCSNDRMVEVLTGWELGLSTELMDLLRKMLLQNPRDRLCLEQVWSHSWMNNNDP